MRNESAENNRNTFETQNIYIFISIFFVSLPCFIYKKNSLENM